MAEEFQGNPFVSFSNQARRRLANEFPELTVDWQEEVESTNDRALWLAEHREMLKLPMLVLADRQVAGRGRKTNTWWSSPGALTFSLLMDADSLGLTPDLWPQASLTTGLAVCVALEELLVDARVQLKWPNDVYVNGKKNCGILLEPVNLQAGLLVIGVGVNVNNSLVQAPPEIESMATALCDVGNQQYPLQDVLSSVLERLLKYLSLVGKRDAQLHDQWRGRCLLTGRKIAVEAATESHAGICQGIGEDGGLLLETENGTKRCLAGTVRLLDS